jgi:hypothetical protein
MAIFDSGTKTIFHQTSAPTGWTKETVNYDNHALRIVNGSSLTSGGSVDFTTAFTATAYTYSNVVAPYTVGNYTLAMSNLPFHLHPVAPSTNRFAISGTTTTPVNATSPISPAVSVVITIGSAVAMGTAVGSSGAHNHTLDVTASGNVFGPNSSVGVNYIDVIIASYN